MVHFVYNKFISYKYLMKSLSCLINNYVNYDYLWLLIMIFFNFTVITNFGIFIKK